MTRDNDIAQQTIEQIRVNVAFEAMIVAVLTGAAAGAVMTLAINLFGLMTRGFIMAGFLSAVLDAMLVGFLVFLVGFGASVAIGAPLFVVLEKRKRRNVWPYLAAAIGVAIGAYFFAASGLPATEEMGIGAVAAIFAPAAIIAVMFARLMKPHWRAAEKAEREAAAGPILVRLN
ncbi:MAG: hypothetical protein AAFW68_06750 [Pseudomonadota bacterium]